MSADAKPDEIDLLLPWHAVERLTPEDADRVEAAIAHDPRRARDLDVVREERAETIALNQDLGLPSRRARDALFARIDAAGASAPRPSLMQRLQNGFAALSPRNLALAAAAASLVIALQASLLARAYLGDAGPVYQTASAPGAAGPDKGAYALVAFSAEAPAGRVADLLRDLRATIVDGPRPGGFYRLRVSEGPMDAQALAAALDRLRARTDLVRFAQPERPPQ